MRIIAYYLPQFHAIPENDQWWGKGFTEWTSVRQAKPLYKGHKQPIVPGELGYYNLMDASVRDRQAQLAKEAGVEGFCYWHYWFAGKQLLEKPLQQVMESGQPDFPFCVGWANESWKAKVWHDTSGQQDQTLISQTYPEGDTIAHFNALLPLFKDARYIRIDGKPVMLIYRPFQLPNAKQTLLQWQQLAKENGLDGIYMIGHTLYSHEAQTILKMGFDAVNVFRMGDCKRDKWLIIKNMRSLWRFYRHQGPMVYPYKDAIRTMTGSESKQDNIFPTILPRWDHTPRSGINGFVLDGSTPELFRKHVCIVKQNIAHKSQEHQVVFLKSWNEWGEGNYIEPDKETGNKYLEILKQVMYDTH